MMGLFCFLINGLNAQDQRVADSLIPIYETGTLQDVEKLELLREISFNQVSDPDLKLKYAQELIREARAAGNNQYLYYGYFQSGYSYNSNGELQKALTSFFKSAELASGLSLASQGAANGAIADVYATLEDYNNANRYYKKAIDILRKGKDSIALGAALLNAGDNYFNANRFEEALLHFEESGQIFSDLNYSIGIAYNLGNIGMVYAEQGRDSLAETNMNAAISELEKIGDYYPISVYLTYMADIYLRKNEYPIALDYAKRSLDMARSHGLVEQIRDANLKLFELSKQKGKFEESLGYLQNYHIYRDSILNIEAVEEMANLRADYEVSQKQAEIDLKQSEVDLLDQQKKNQQLVSLSVGIGLLLILIVAIGLFRRNKFISRSKALIEKEKKRSDLLLLNILPEETASELKDKGRVEAKRFESVTVMFTDFKGFTAYSDRLSPEELVDSIDFYYSKFDEIIEKHGLEKIKTVGDAYMCAGGLPKPMPDHAHKMVEAAFEIVEFVRESKKYDPDDMTRFEIRVGINTGPVVAGVVGTKKFAYDIWGDTVNIASRMESNSEPGKINISENTYELIKDKFRCTYRGEIEAKNKGMMKMFFAEGILTDQISNTQV